MDPVTASLATAGLTEALKSWGAYALVLMPLGAWLWHLIRENRLLRTELSSLQEKRLLDSQNLTRVVQSGTSTIAARTEAQDRFAEAITTMAHRLEMLERKVAPKAPSASRATRSR